MMRALNSAGTGMIAQQINLDVISNNLANVNTTGFKGQRAEFTDLMYQTFRAGGATSGGAQRTPAPLQIGLGSKFTSTATNFQSGSLQITNDPMDMAITGPGFFRVLMPDGTISVTRDGSFKRDASGLVVNSDGYPLEPAITIPANSSNITVSPDGQVSYTNPTSGQVEQGPQITIATFANPAGLTRIGGNLYKASAASGEEQVVAAGTEGTGSISSGYLEGSNVQIVEEMVRMILAQRAYEINSKAIQTSDEMLSTLNNLKR